MTAAAAPTDVAPRRAARRDPALLLYAVLCYVPLLLASPGQVAADTKAYLYLDPGRLLSRAGWLWEQDIAAGTITHQNIGYLFPMGPWYWCFERLGAPDWVAQRLWLGSILFVAGTGARWLAQRLDLRGAPATVAGVVYLTSPYVLPYFGRTSALLLPWAALPWLLALVIVSLRTDRWRAPVLFALVFTCVSGTNASSLVFVAVGPLLWVPYAIWVVREMDVRRALRTSMRLAITTIPAQLWWVAGLRMQGRYGLPILKLTESVDTVAQTSTAAEVARGLGYWYDYGRDGLSPWTTSAQGHTQHLWLLATSFAIPLLAMLGAAFTRWRMRAFAVAMFAVGLVAGVGTYPYEHPPLFGSIVKATTETAGGLALRNTPRAVPLIGLAYALLIGAGLQAVRARLAVADPRRARPIGRGLVAGVAVLAIVNLPPLLTGAFISSDLRFPEHLPAYWLDATAALDAAPHDSRVLELPGSDFAAYRWGETQDPVTPGLIDRPWVGRELTAFGTPGSVDLVRALDRRAQEGVFDAAAVAPVARLLAAGDVLVRNDTQYERYRGPRPRTLWPQLAGASGLGATTAFGTPVRNAADPRRPMIDEIELGTAPTVAEPPPLAVRAVPDPNPLVAAKSVAGAIVVAGDGEGLVDAAAVGLVDPDALVVYSGTFASDPDTLRTLAAQGATLVLTDGNRKRAQRWGPVRENNGYTEPAGSSALVTDTKDTRLALFATASTDAFTVARYAGVSDIRASTYGNIVAYSPERRASNVLDGDLRTSWEVGGFSDVLGERVRVDLAGPVTTDHLDVVQSNGNRYITELGVRIDGGPKRLVRLEDASHTDAGQRIDLGGMVTFSSLELSIDGANVTGLQNYLGWSTAGIRELRVPGVTMEEQIVVPRDLLATLGTSSSASPLSVVLTRLRADAGEPFRADPEPRLVRVLTLPTARSFSLRGEARVESRADGAVIDRILGRPGAGAGFATASGTDFLAGSIAHRPSSAIDGDLATYWSPNLGDQNGRTFHVALASRATVDRLALAVVADGRHSVPTQLTLTTDEGTSVVVDLPPVVDGTEPDHVVRVDLPVPSFSTSGFRVTVRRVRDVTSIEYFSGEPSPLPVGIAELGLGDASRTAAPLVTDVPNDCRTDLLTIDGAPVGVRITGTTAAATRGEALGVALCGAGPLALGAGEHVLRSANGIDTGFALDRIVLDSGAVRSGAPATRLAGPAPAVGITGQSHNRYVAEVRGATEPFWLVLHESLSEGWHATVDGRDLGAPTMVDGYANGWLIDPRTTGADFTVTMRWTPQGIVWIAIVASGIALLALVAAALVLWWRDRHGGRAAPFGVDGETSPELLALASPIGAASRTVVLRDAIVAGVLGGALGGATVGVGALILVALGSSSARGRLVLRLAPVAAFGFTMFWYVAKQWRNRYPMGVEWPDSFARTHAVVLTAMVVLVAETVLRHRDRRTGSVASAGPAGSAAVPGPDQSSPASERA